MVRYARLAEGTFDFRTEGGTSCLPFLQGLLGFSLLRSGALLMGIRLFGCWKVFCRKVGRNGYFLLGLERSPSSVLSFVVPNFRDPAWLMSDSRAAVFSLMTVRATDN